MFDFDFSTVSEFYVSPHRDGQTLTVSFDGADDERLQLVVPAKELPPFFHKEGAYKKRNNKWTRVVRIDGDTAINALKALLGEA